MNSDDNQLKKVIEAWPSLPVLTKARILLIIAWERARQAIGKVVSKFTR